jgi:FkbM family methyltransferase
MRLRDFFKILARSKSLGFAIQTARQVPSKSLASLRWRGHNVFYRPGTSDQLAIYQVLLRKRRKAEYYVPSALEPNVILDIGSNIGASILFFHELFPSAKILGFEPHPETFRILQSNVSAIPSVSVFNYALGSADARISVPFEGMDFSAFTTKIGSRMLPDASATTDCEMKHAGSALRDLGISTVDLIKIDCEGAEYDILRTLPEEMLKRCKWIVGEIHDSCGFDLLALLAPHFDLDLKKRMFVPFFRFHACNLGHVQELRGTFNRNALQR